MANVRNRARKKGIVACTIYLRAANWEWAKSQPEGASKFLDNWLYRTRLRDERENKSKVIAAKDAEIARLKGILRALGRNDEAPQEGDE